MDHHEPWLCGENGIARKLKIAFQVFQKLGMPLRFNNGNMFQNSNKQTYLGPCQAFMMELFAKIVDGFQPLIFFCKELHSIYLFERVLNMHKY